MIKHKKRHFVSLTDLSTEDILQLVFRGLFYADHDTKNEQPLKGLIIGIYFLKTSTRTRTSFSSAALRLGGQIITYGAQDLQLNTGETVHDTAKILALMLDGLVVRTAGKQDDMRIFASQSDMGVINAMSEDEHPTQAIADLTTIMQHFGRLKDLRVLYMGEGNNSATALALSLSRFSGTELLFCTPPGYGIPSAVMAEARNYAELNGSSIREQHNLENLPSSFDVIYTTRWETTGTIKKDYNWKDIFVPFKVTQALMEAYPEAIFMHDLPAHRDQEVDSVVIDGPRSIVFKQAENKFHSACAVLEWCLAPSAINMEK